MSEIAIIKKVKEDVDILKIDFKNFTIRDYNYKYSLLNNPQRKILMPVKSVKAIGNFMVTKDNPPRPGNVGELPFNKEIIPKTISDVYNLKEIDYCRLSMFYNEDFGIQNPSSSLEVMREAFFEWLGCNTSITGTPQ